MANANPQLFGFYRGTSDTFFSLDYLASNASGGICNNISTYNASGDGWGLVQLEPGSTGAWQAPYKQHFICYVSAGEVAVTFGDGYLVGFEEIVVNEGWLWEVKRGNTFRPRNTSDKRAATFVYVKVSSPRAI